MPSQCDKCGSVSHDRAVHCAAPGCAGHMVNIPCRTCAELRDRLYQRGPHGEEVAATVIWQDDEPVTQVMWAALRGQLAEDAGAV